MFDKIIFAERLHTLRNESKLNQTQLGDIVGISQFAISKIEKGQRAASIEVLCSLADYFNVSLDYLVGRSDNPEVNK